MRGEPAFFWVDVLKDKITLHYSQRLALVNFMFWLVENGRCPTLEKVCNRPRVDSRTFEKPTLNKWFELFFCTSKLVDCSLVQA